MTKNESPVYVLLAVAYQATGGGFAASASTSASRERVATGRAGMPTTTASAATSRVTTALAPTRARALTVIETGIDAEALASQALLMESYGKAQEVVKNSEALDSQR